VANRAWFAARLGLVRNSSPSVFIGNSFLEKYC
jgi:hypothetical protein